jgi:hypothetical protein
MKSGSCGAELLIPLLGEELGGEDVVKNAEVDSTALGFGEVRPLVDRAGAVVELRLLELTAGGSVGDERCVDVAVGACDVLEPVPRACTAEGNELVGPV